MFTMKAILGLALLASLATIPITYANLAPSMKAAISGKSIAGPDITVSVIKSLKPGATSELVRTKLSQNFISENDLLIRELGMYSMIFQGPDFTVGTTFLHGKLVGVHVGETWTYKSRPDLSWSTLEQQLPRAAD